MFDMKFRLMAPEGDATGGGGADFLGSLSAGSGEPAAPAQADNPPAAPAGGAQPSVTPDLPGWANAVTKELRSDPRFLDFAKQYGKFDEVVKSAIELKTKAGEVPETPDGYELELDKDIQFDETELKEYRDMVHKLGLSKTQAAELHKLAAATAKTQLAAYQQKQAEAQQAKIDKAKADFVSLESGLRKEWGQNYQANQEIATRGLKAYATPELIKALQGAELGNNPAIIRHFYELGKLTREDSAISGNGTRTRDKSLEDIMYPQSK